MEPEDLNRKISALSAALDFHSDRATAHASFFVASIFGLFTTLSLYPYASKVWLMGLLAVSFWFIWGFGAYSLYNFGRFAAIAQGILSKIREMGSTTEIESEEVKRWDKRHVKFMWFKSIPRKLHVFLILYFLLVGVVPFLIVCWPK